jgi:hypothetical protein
MKGEGCLWSVLALVVAVFVAVCAYQTGRNMTRTEAAKLGLGEYYLKDGTFANESPEWRWKEVPR